MIPYTLTENAVTVVLDFVPHVVPRTHVNWDKIIAALTNGGTVDTVRPLIDIPAAVANFMKGAIEIKDRALYWNGRPLDTSLTRRILQHMDGNNPALADPLIAFLENVMENPSYRAVQGLFEWVEKSSLPITPDGYILAWKAVREDYTSIHQTPGRVYDHTPGNIVEMPRNECDEDPEQTCSTGLHFCSANYLRNYAGGGNRFVVVKVHPRDVTAIPKEYGCEKGRCCCYEVVGEVPKEKVPEFYPNAYVYDGTFTDEEEAPSPLDLKVGQRWRTRGGDIVTIVGNDGHEAHPWDIQHKDGTFFDYVNDAGRVWDDIESENDLVELISHPAFDYKVGQVYRQRNGGTVTVRAIEGSYPAADDGSPYVAVFSDGHLRTAEGFFWGRDQEYEADLIELISEPEIKVGDVEWKIGQIWERRDGHQSTVSRIGYSLTGFGNVVYFGDDAAVWAGNGRVYWHIDGPNDVVRLIQDVA
jgi:hypothetical protein